jgi:predicted GNAT family acetyltransferase
MDLEHTVVKPVARGMGVGAALADAACAHAREQGWDVQASCSFISDKYFTERPAKGFTYDPSTKLATLLA